MIDLHVHTKYSLLDSITEPKELIQTIVAQGKQAICVTDHGNLYGSVEIYKLCQEYGVKYLHGCEMYICDDATIRDKNNKYYHLIVISKNEQGRLNLLNLVSESNRYKYYGKPRIDFEMLKQRKDGLIVLSACMAGEVQRALADGNDEQARQVAQKYKDVFGEDYYLEYQSHSDPTQQALNRRVVDLANELGIKYVVTTDAHYVKQEDQKYHNVFVQIGQSREAGETYNDCYIQSEDDILRICQSTTREENLIAIQNTHEIADKCNVTIPLSPPIMPHEPVPQGFKSEIDYLKHLCLEGWKNRRISELYPDQKEVYKKRLAYEISVIQEMGFEGYYLVVWGYVMAAQRRGIARGSGGGSLVAYLIGIVDTDPVKYGLYFERFIDVGALELLQQGKITKSQLKIPDFDVDFGQADRERVMKFVIEKYGQDKVACLGSFQYIWAKGAIKDIGRVLGIPFEVTNEMTSKLDKETIQEVIDLGILDSYKAKYPELFVYAQKLAGLPKAFSAHPCGRLICEQPVIYYNAIDINDNGDVILQGDMHTAEDLGLIKADFLGLRTVDVIYDTLEMLGKDYEYIAPHNINFEDPLVFENFRDGNTFGIFQFESDGMKKTLREIECNSLMDLTVANALFRPGAMAYIENYANRRKGIEEFEYLHPSLEPILKSTYGIIVFQEQLIEIGRMAKLNNPDELRKATAKKKPELLEKLKPELFDGLSAIGWNQEQLEILWDTMVDFGRYSFNKSHALGYSMMAYICMYLKVHHPREFMCALINSYDGKIEKISNCIKECKRLGLKLYYGKFEQCSGKTILYKEGLLLGTNTVKYLNSQIADELMELSKNEYPSFVDLITDIKTQTSINARQLEILIALDFFERFGKNKFLLNVLNVYNKYYSKKQIKKSDIESLGLTEEVVRKYSAKETKALFKEINGTKLVQELTRNLENKAMSIIDVIRFQMEVLEYCTYSNPSIHEDYYIVIDFKTYKDATKPYVTLWNLKNGYEVKTRIKQSKIYKEAPFGLYNVLKIREFSYQFKSKMVNGAWTQTNEVENILQEYEVIK